MKLSNELQTKVQRTKVITNYYNSITKAESLASTNSRSWNGRAASAGRSWHAALCRRGPAPRAPSSASARRAAVRPAAERLLSHEYSPPAGEASTCLVCLGNLAIWDYSNTKNTEWANLIISFGDYFNCIVSSSKLIELVRAVAMLFIFE